MQEEIKQRRTKETDTTVKKCRTPDFKGRERCMAPDTSQGGKPWGPATDKACEDILVVTVARATRICYVVEIKRHTRG